MSKIMTAEEWLINEGYSPLHADEIKSAAERYASYYHSAKMQEVGEDVENRLKSIIAEHLDIWVGDEGDIRASTLHNVKMQSVLNAAKEAYNLHKSDAVEFAEFILNDYETYYVQGEPIWILAGTAQEYTTEQLYQLFTQQKSKTNGK